MNRIDRITRWQTKVDSIVASYKRLDRACDAAMDAGTMDPNGPLYEAVWNAHDGALKHIDVDGWIAWFIYENDCGAKGMEAKGCGRTGKKPIKTTRQLARLIVESEEHSE